MSEEVDHQLNDTLQLLHLHTSELRKHKLFCEYINWKYVAERIKSYSEVEIICFIKEVLENAIIRCKNKELEIRSVDFRNAIYKYPTTYKSYTKIYDTAFTFVHQRCGWSETTDNHESGEVIEKCCQHSMHENDDTIDIIYQYRPLLTNAVTYDEIEMIKYFRWMKENVTNKEKRLSDKKEIHYTFISAIFNSTCKLPFSFMNKALITEDKKIKYFKTGLRKLRELFLLYKNTVPDTLTYINAYFEDRNLNDEIATRVIEKTVKENKPLFKDGSTIDINSDEFKRRVEKVRLIEGFSKELIVSYFRHVENEKDNKEREEKIDDMLSAFIADVKKIDE